ncbi:putative pentatricopeptide repeat-containing protein At5g09950 isoform X2 [Populus alba]|uniref:putative pentatricopeptide repeat-containing protein At5g09950 isoform X2 n=1 Tax=Populus alba TaxID=43335 RepID=UPI0015887D27|nr:putative pentatricopeptide repeat-containing protein At5g09950 isoform X2 [Populus alba]
MPCFLCMRNPGFAGNGRAGQALGVFLRMQKEGLKPTEYTHVSVLNACTQLLDLRRGKQIHGRIIICNLGGNVFVCNALTDLYARCGEIDQARKLFDRMVIRNVVTWNLMISGYLKNRQPEKCIDLFHEMQVSNLKPDQVTVSSVLGAYIQGGYIDEARKVFGEVREKDEVCWTTMIVGCAQNGKEEDALLLFSEMLLENARPDGYTISSVVSSCAKLASLYHGQAVHGKAFLMGVNDDLLVSSALVDMYCKCGVTRDAWTIFSTMQTRNVVSWNSMIGGYALNGQDLEALSLYENMLEENLKPDSVTFVGVLSACVHAGLVEEGKEYFSSMNDQHGLEPTPDHYACMVNLFGRSGHMDKAVDLISSMSQEPNSLIWSTVLSVCVMKGDIKHGEMAARCLIELNPFNAVPYIMLSNMYAARGRWKDVASIRSLMKSKHVKKFSAYSWIEIDNEVHKFVADDRTHPDAKIIHVQLNRLIRKLKEAGFSPNTNLVLHDFGEDEKLESINYHSEKLALAYGLIKKPYGVTPIRIIKNIRTCADCHMFMKFVSNIARRPVILRDSNRFHHFVEGKCSCKDYW